MSAKQAERSDIHIVAEFVLLYQPGKRSAESSFTSHKRPPVIFMGTRLMHCCSDRLTWRIRNIDSTTGRRRSLAPCGMD